MLIRKAYKYRVKTELRHELRLRQAAGCSRFVWNKALALKKGRLEALGRQVKQKAGLNKVILDQGCGEVMRLLEYKQQWRGRVVVVVPTQYTSKTCPECGHVHKDNLKSQSGFKCIRCLYTANADHAGARNILAAGYSVSACGEVGVVIRPLDEAGVRKDAA